MKLQTPPPKEFRLHVAFADLVRYSLVRGWQFTHLPFGEKRDPVTAGRLQRMGVVAGYPDFLFTGPGCGVFWLELKRPGGRMSDAQTKIHAHLIACGFVYHCTDDLADAIGTLRNLGIIRAQVTV